MAKDKTPTAVVRRPIDTFPQTEYFSRRTPYVAFKCAIYATVRAGAPGLVTNVRGDKVTLYAELPNMTVRMVYEGVANVYVRAGQYVEEGTALGLGTDILYFWMERLIDGAPVIPEFFSTFTFPNEFPPNEMHGPF